ncbi:hypothetical protein Sam112_gp40 [Bacillus phage vB_BcM_Sam112]|uniref:Uncharacterized protein n=1 Tax=Bacillus phage vB_BcM_Sam112 TaxID=2663324 RepID=A0A5Q2F3X0_9CAUD|nr:hypothetical protein Sam112_gp40 [Bacillus phage vB_BcM_Sam112]
MAKQQVIKFKDFMDGSYNQSKKDRSIIQSVKCLTAAVPPVLMLIPKITLAATVSSSFGNIHGVLMNGIDAGVVLVLLFGGCSWILGHRGKAIEVLMSVSCGYILCRHAVDIRDFLKTI